MKYPVLALVFACAAIANAAASPPELWSALPISSDRYESHPAFDPVSGDLMFVRGAPKFSGWRLFVSACGPNGWQTPSPVSFAGDGVEADPFFTSDAKTLYFISSRSENGTKQRELDVWRVARDSTGAWGTPERLPEPVNSAGNEWFPRLTADGTLYFGSDREGGLGQTDIYRARIDATGAWRVENLGAAINSAGDEYEAEISADGARMILMADGDLYESRLISGEWRAREKLGDSVNTAAMEVGPLLSPDGNTLLFARDSGDPALSGELYRHGASTWPPLCGQR